MKNIISPGVAGYTMFVISSKGGFRAIPRKILSNTILRQYCIGGGGGGGGGCSNISYLKYIHYNDLKYYYIIQQPRFSIRVAYVLGMPGTFSLPLQASRHERHARVVMHVRIVNPRVAGKTFPAFPARAQTAILRVWQEARYLDQQDTPGRKTRHLKQPLVPSSTKES